MIRRRTLLASSVAVPVAARAAAFGSGQGAGPVNADLRYLVIAEPFDRDGPSTLMVADSGASILRLTRDLTLAYDVLDRELQSQRFAIAGMTSGNAFFVLERLARDRGLKTVFRGTDIRQVLSAWYAGQVSAATAPKPFQAAPSAAGEKLVSWLLVPR